MPKAHYGGMHQSVTNFDQADSPPNAQPAGELQRADLWWSRLAGVVSGVAGLAVADLVARLVAPAGSTVGAVSEWLITLFPAGLVNWGKDTLGTADKPFLMATIAVVVLVVAGLAGQAEHRRKYAGGAIFAALAALGLIGVAHRVGSSLTGYLPTVVGLLIGYMILSTLITRLQRWHPRRAEAISDPGGASASRRSFLGLTIAVGSGAAVATIAGRLLASASNAVSEVRSKIVLPKPRQAAAPVPAGAELNVSGLSPYVTPNADFYRIDTAFVTPVIQPEKWELKITGMVENEITINFAELTARPMVEHLTTLTCVSNTVGGSLVGNALWLGYPIRDLLAEAKPLPGADMVLSTSDDGWTAGTPLDALTDPAREALLAVGMNGEPLPVEHGFPVRMVVPGLYGYVSATKWVVKMKVTTFDKDRGYWTPLGWSALGPIKIASRIDTPRKSEAGAGPVVVAGVAWAQHLGISKVEVRVDQGGWQPAALAETVGPDTWRQWKFDWDAAVGDHTLSVRATDANGNVQTEDDAPPEPDGATGWHTINVKVT